MKLFVKIYVISNVKIHIFLLNLVKTLVFDISSNICHISKLMLALLIVSVSFERVSNTVLKATNLYITNKFMMHGCLLRKRKHFFYKFK